ncbi:unnamed protein product [Toxocara canis]|uniref:PPPDE domain-containing protein n=1 Tax=Toxocara canis TaxID=6265 RepID=A0A183UL35_TOXCA|nr:unnamed protein product [Toxocara canis]
MNISIMIDGTLYEAVHDNCTHFSFKNNITSIVRCIARHLFILIEQLVERRSDGRRY